MCDWWTVKVKDQDCICVWRGSRRSVGSSFHRQGAAYRKKRLVIFKEDRVGGRARVTMAEELVLWQGWTDIKSWRYWGWFVVRTLYVREMSLYLMRSFILSQCTDLRTGVMWEDFGILVTARVREFWMLWSLLIWVRTIRLSTVKLLKDRHANTQTTGISYTQHTWPMCHKLLLRKT